MTRDQLVHEVVAKWGNRSIPCHMDQTDQYDLWYDIRREYDVSLPFDKLRFCVSWDSVARLISDTLELRKRDELYALALEYHLECDCYDSKVCTGKFKGEPHPGNYNESVMISINARNVLKRTIYRAMELGYTNAELLHEIQKMGNRKGWR